MTSTEKIVQTGAGRAHLTVHPKDNVTTLLDERRDVTSLAGGGHVAPGIAFGHKAALVMIPKGADILKYSVVIGQATQDIQAGEHVHVHNCR